MAQDGTQKAHKPKRADDRRRGYGSGRVVELPNGRFRAVVDVSQPTDRKRKRLVRTFTTKTEAETWIKQSAGDRAHGVRVPEAITLGEWLTQWLADLTEIGRVTESTIRQYQTISASYLVPVLGSRKLGAITVRDCELAFAKLAKPGAAPSVKRGRARNDTTLSPATVGICKRVLRAALSAAQREGLIKENPAKLASLPYKSGATKPVHKTLSDAEIDALMATLRTTKNTVAPVVQFALATGARLGEILALRLEDIDVDGRRVRISRTLSRTIAGPFEVAERVKTDSSDRGVPLGQLALDALRAEGKARAANRLRLGSGWSENGLAFPSAVGTVQHPRNVQARWHRLCDDAGIAKRGFHSLRHSTATVLLNGGMPIEAVARVLGHSGTKVTSAVYAAVLDRMTEPAAATLDAAFGRDDRLTAKK